jgi:hydroxymethylbilane synthase
MNRETKRKIRIGTRGSQLALWQANFVERALRHRSPGTEFETVVIKTEGDRDQLSSLTRIGGLGVFTKAIEEALLERRIDIAVHSLKDLPSAMTNGLALGAVPERGFVEDVLVTKRGTSLAAIASKSVVATGSIRRRSQLLNLRPDLEIRDLRGNIGTRLRKLNDDGLDGIIMARAAIERLQLRDVKYYVFSTREMIPGVGQGALGIQIRKEDEEVGQIVALVDHRASSLAVTAERAFLRELDSGCQFPVGAYAKVEDNRLTVTGFVGSEDGRKFIRDLIEGGADDAPGIGRALAKAFIEKGAIDILNGAE